MNKSNSRKGENHPKAKLTTEQVRQIRDLFSKGFSTNVIARNYKVSTWNVEEIVKRKTWTHI
jgi:DNA-binding NarL/FixJ family response regulator